ncbi:MAG TPA: type I polyketide synthase, partial [Thermoanaerobaculia bacterium]
MVEGCEVAVIGMAGRFPGADSIDRLWRNLCDGLESITFFTRDELRAAGVAAQELADPDYVPANGILLGVEDFAAEFFGFTAREAQITDPQHRLFLECAWEALEDAGYDGASHGGPVGVYAGVNRNTYVYNLLSHPDLLRAVGGVQVVVASDKDYLAARVSYKLDLHGPSIVVQTACSTSLVAVHLAVQGLLAGDCDMALAGGVSVLFPQVRGYRYTPDGIYSPDGHCRAFDAAAAGTLNGNGLGIVVLKRLEQALADGDHVYAVIKGTAVNNDGALKVGFTAPSIAGQAQVIRAAQAVAGVEPSTIGYVEAHGTGTALGDPIEVAALAEVFGAAAADRPTCAIGSVKTHLGHLDTAAGVTGLIVAVLALARRRLPPSLHYSSPNPRIDFARSPFYVNTELRPWENNGLPRRAAVSSFGLGGTNAHAVLEEAPAAAAGARPSRPWQLLLLSARTPAALEQATRNLAGSLAAKPEHDFADVAFTLQTGRRRFEQRRALVCNGAEDAARALAALDPERVLTQARQQGEPWVVFLFPGQGAQYAGMGRQLYDAEPLFREQIDACAELLVPLLGLDLRRVLYPPPEEAAAAAGRLRETALTQPALFSVEYALARLWMEWGIAPEAMAGHSLGEYVAACLAGVFSLADALALVAARGRLMQGLAAGGMLAVNLAAAELAPDLGSGLDLAAVNGPRQCVVAGAEQEIEELAATLRRRGVRCRRLGTSHAFHSRLVEPVLGAFAAELARIELQPPRRRFLSSLSGGWVDAPMATDPGYWLRQLRETVRFGDALDTLLAEPGRIVLEVGPGQTLGELVRQHPGGAQAVAVLPSLRRPEERVPDQA